MERSIVNTKIDWEDAFASEIENAEVARASGNEGKARVCARRAAGIAAGEYFTRRGTPSRQGSAYSNLQRLHDQPDLPEPIRKIAAHFLERITEDHELPSRANLIAEARLLADKLLKET
jgi:hypothetical protein